MSASVPGTAREREMSEGGHSESEEAAMDMVEDVGADEVEEEEEMDVGERQQRAMEERAHAQLEKERQEAEKLARERKAAEKEQERLLLEARNNPSWSICDGGCSGCWKFVEAQDSCRNCGCARLSHVRNMDDCEADADDEDYESIYGGGESW
eukprot:TRINITY_DN9496_c0_g1_i1.p2 TRINITY_DN9496_c0_g1~~TRINITY_DN9496_c0_g1_i1.p2  ORF type:complete len:153 (+),score=12.99 TRINITY_DN9496_c0_g1_i1:93-551(+)